MYQHPIKSRELIPHASSGRRDLQYSQSGHTRRSRDDSALHPINYSGTQVNIYGQPNADTMNKILGPGSAGAGAHPGLENPFYPYGGMYPATGYTNNVQLGLVTEHMLRKMDESRMYTMTELLRRSQTNAAPTRPYVEEPPSPRFSIEHMRAYPLSPGSGDWKGQIEHICAHLYEVAASDRYFRKNIGEPQFGEILAADLDETHDNYRLILTFSKPKGTAAPSNTFYTRHNTRRPPTPTSDLRRVSSSTKTATARDSGRDDMRLKLRNVGSKVKQRLDENDQSQYEKESVKQEGTVKPYRQFSAEADAEALRKAMKGLGTDENVIVNVLGKRSNSQRQEVIKMYKTMFGKDLVKDLKSELSGDFWKVVRALCLPPADYDATELRNAIKGMGTDDNTLIEIICTRTNRSIKLIKEAYKRLFNKSLEEDIMDDTSGHYQRLLVSLLQANRDDSNVVDKNLAKKDAKMLHEAGAKKWGTDESRFNSILVSRSFAQLRATFEAYELLAAKTVQDAIEAELSGDLQTGMLTIVHCVADKTDYFAQQLYNSMKGLGSDDEGLIRIVVSRCEVDMVQIKENFSRHYKQSLAQFVADDTSGDYRKILLTLIGESNAGNGK